MINQLFEVTLEKNYGHCIVSVVSYSGYGMGNLHAINPMNFFSMEPVSSVPEIDQIAAPILCLSKPPSRGPKKWRFLKQVEDGKDFETPLCICDFSQRCRRTDDWNQIEWDLIQNLERVRVNYHKYCQVAHLSDWGMSSAPGVVKNLTMLWMRINGVDIKKFYDTEAIYTNEEFLYKRVMNMKLYTEIDRTDRNRVIDNC